jgi:hypothetical protein
MATNNKQIQRIPGTKQFQLFLKENGDIFNFSELERLCDFSIGTLRYVTKGRELTIQQYRKVQKCVLPKLCEAVFLLQNYDV